MGWESGGNTPDVPIGTGVESIVKNIDSNGEVDPQPPDQSGDNETNTNTNVPAY